MSEPQKVQLSKSGRDAALDLISLGILSLMTYFAMHPEAYDRLTTAVQSRFDALVHRLSVWQTKLSIRSLPETEDS